jgi:hypothetical protein
MGKAWEGSEARELSYLGHSSSFSCAWAPKSTKRTVPQPLWGHLAPACPQGGSGHWSCLRCLQSLGGRVVWPPAGSFCPQGQGEVKGQHAPDTALPLESTVTGGNRENNRPTGEILPQRSAPDTSWGPEPAPEEGPSREGKGGIKQ